MKFLGLIFRNMTHSRRRTILTILSIAVALFLFATLRTVLTAFNAAIEVADDTRLIVRRSTSLVFPLPVAYRDRIAGVNGVTAVSWGNWFGGIYQDPQKFFAKFGVDVDTYFDMYPELLLPPEQLAAFKADRTGCVVGSGLAKKYGFKVGDTLPIVGTIYPYPDGNEWRFTVRGIYTPETPDVDDLSMYFNWDYLNQTMGDPGIVGFYIVKLADSGQTAVVGDRIDGLFANSPYETKTETEAAFQAGFLSMIGNIGFLVSIIGAAIVFAIALVTFNTMMMAARERTKEIAVMKTLGFSDGSILGLIVAEATFISLIGGALGIGLATFLYWATGFDLMGFVPSFLVKPATIGYGLLLSLGMGVLSGLIPALQAARMPISRALREGV
ncbi:MAG TPA: FtsX-like permease family protein [Candidatus Eisenbacteria bacterium]